MPEYPDVGGVARLDIFSAGADNDKNVENETSLRVEAQRVSGCGWLPSCLLAVWTQAEKVVLDRIESASCVQWIY